MEANQDVRHPSTLQRLATVAVLRKESSFLGTFVNHEPGIQYEDMAYASGLGFASVGKEITISNRTRY